MTILYKIEVPLATYLPAALPVGTPFPVDLVHRIPQQSYGVRYGRTGDYVGDRHPADHWMRDAFRVL